MTRIIAVILITLLVAPSASAGPRRGKPINWEKVQKLKAGSKLILTTQGGQPTEVRLLYADDATLFTMRDKSAKLAPRIAVFLQNVGAEWPAVASGEADHVWGELRVSMDGIWSSGEKLYNLGEVVQFSSRSEVKELGVPRTLRAFWIGAAVFGALLLILGLTLEPD